MIVLSRTPAPWHPVAVAPFEKPMTPPDSDASALLRNLFDAALGAADPMRVVPLNLPPRPSGRVVVVGAGMASARMAEAVESVWGPCEGLVITRTGEARPLAGIEVVEAAHPVPDAAGVAATQRMLDLLTTCNENDFVLALISGGASALLAAPVGGVSLADKQALNRALLESGAPLGQINLVRKHLSRVKGGRLAAAAWPARMLALVLSNVAGDDPAVIGSGPTVGEGSTAQDALRVLDHWRIDLPIALRATIAQAAPPPPPEDDRLSRTTTRIIGTPSQALAAAGDAAIAAGCRVEILGAAVSGDAGALAREHAQLARRTRLAPGSAPLVLLAAGDLSVAIEGAAKGSGGPNAEYALALGMALEGNPNIWAIACDMDGIDGNAAVAGALIGPDFARLVAETGLNPRRALATHDAHGFFAAIGGQVATGPTGCNPCDFRAILIRSEPRRAI